MGAIDSILTKFFGNKSTRDLKTLTPYVDKIKAVYPQIKELNHDELRNRSAALKAQILGSVDEERNRIQSLKGKIETDNPSIDEREKIYSEIDKIEKEITEKLEVALNEALPEAFAIIKDTARRLTEFETIEVTANDFDRELATSHDFVEIKGTRQFTKIRGWLVVIALNGKWFIMTFS